MESENLRDTPIDGDATGSTEVGWKWQALVEPPDVPAQWRVWLAEAQRAEEASLLRYWSRRAA
jgi:hypothetical protein